MNKEEAQLHAAVLRPGRYIVAVSGGVDSMVLLNMLKRMPELDLVVAHVDHGIRADSAKDRELVQRIAMSHNIPFIYTQLSLGARASEEVARHARYDFLRHARKKYNALAIMTAHHQDDLLETALMNLLRGTGRYGLNTLTSQPDIIRPLLHIPKRELLAYATRHNLSWREDSTNRDQRHLRNYVRHRVLARADTAGRNHLLSIIVRHAALNHAIDTEVSALYARHATVQSDGTTLPRHQLIMLPQAVAYELLQHAVRQQVGSRLLQPLAWRALHFVKTARLHRQFELNCYWRLRIGRQIVIVEPRGPMVS